MNILFSSAGRRVELLNCFRSDARELNLSLKVFASDANSRMSPACHFADASFSVPRCADPAFVPSLLDVCEKQRIQLLIPTIDTELEMLARSKKEFAKIGTLVAISDADTVGICRDKLLTAKALALAGVRVPKTVPLEEQGNVERALTYPIILKPKGGSSSQGIIKLNKPDETDSQRRAALVNYIAQELCTGAEYTVNLFFDDSRQLRCAIPHLRIETRSGEVSKGTTERNEQLLTVAQKLAKALPGPFGALCFQAIVSREGEVSVFEINARFGGGYPLAHRAGGKFSKWLLEYVAGLSSSITDQWSAPVTMLRYDSSVFI